MLKGGVTISMKETIYTIPLTEAFHTDCECPFCCLVKKLTAEQIDSFLGPSLMEPDIRTMTNESGFCREHLSMLYASKSNRLGLALILHTHTQEKNAFMTSLVQKAGVPPGNAQRANPAAVKSFSLFQKRGKQSKTAIPTDPGTQNPVGKMDLNAVNDLILSLERLENSCCICDKLQRSMLRYVEVLFYLWDREPEFRAQFAKINGFCLPHFKLILTHARQTMTADDLSEFLSVLLPLQTKNMKRVEDDLLWFTQKFDYRNDDKSWGTSKDALPRAIEKLRGSCTLTERQPK